MAKCRSILVFVLVLALIATPAFACLPSQSVTQAEMACCKKMGGDCNMGTGHHPCCKTSVSPVSPVASVPRIALQIHPDLVAVLVIDILLPLKPEPNRAPKHETLGLPPPPVLNSILRI